MSTLLASLDRVRQYLRNASSAELKEDWEEVKAMNLKGPKYSEIFDEDDWQSQMRSDKWGTIYTFGKHPDGTVSTVATENGLLSLERSFSF